MSDLDKYLNQQLTNPEFKKCYKRNVLKYWIIEKLIRKSTAKK